ncbi:Cullin repeat-like-containing domain-containing protein [Artemisia annua]|uniref:Exocyst subunit Exo70 family protein n=1 Tax=Artemisia annua TaxID=35608 RepID=A0A2U1M5L9_ARTAN|nr:Cullin repeat-like-containing domain-containing protein [Artemisia annua]
METIEEEKIVDAARVILRALDSNKEISDETMKILADLGARLTSMGKIIEKIVAWEGEESMIWDCDPEEAKEYLKTVDEARRLGERLEGLSLSKEENELLRNVNGVLQTSMVRIEEEFRHILVNNRQNFEPEHMSFRSSEDDGLDLNSVVSFGDDSIDDSIQRDSISRGAEVYIMDLINPQVIPDLRSIASLMFDSNYGRECSQAFISARKDALDDCLFILEVEKLSIEDVLKMEWVALNSRIRRWTKAIRIFVRVYLSSEKFLCEQIFGQNESVSSICFCESSKASILQLLNFAEAIAIGPHQPEKLLRILDMYEALADLMPDIEGLYSDENGSYIKTECEDVLKRVGDCVKATFIEFENAVGSNTSNSAFPGGGNHHLTRYVMNYIKTLTDYGDSLNVCLKDDQSFSSSPDINQWIDDDDSSNEKSSSSPMAVHFRSLMSILECNLEEKSKLYRDDALGYIFMMNNINYMAEKVKNSELRNVLGDDWIRKRNWKFQQYAMSYERATWSSILNILKEDGLSNSGSSSSTSRTLLREKLQAFYTAFEEIYKSQTGWSIPNIQLRDDLRISISLKAIQAYRTFIGRHANNISERYIKYAADDLENYILDLFEGTPKSLHGFLRK